MKFVDFGLVVPSGQPAEYPTAGTKSTMAPEVWTEKNYIPRSAQDVYSVGATMYQAMFGDSWYEIAKEAVLEKNAELKDDALDRAIEKYIVEMEPCSIQDTEAWQEEADLICNKMMVPTGGRETPG